MAQAMLEHVNLTVPDAAATAKLMCDLFGWSVRWQGPAKDNGFTVHVGGTDSYLALFTPPGAVSPAGTDSTVTGYLNHVGVVVDDLDAVEARVKAAGYTPTNHGDYEPGRRFYFEDGDGVEYEVVSYA